MIFAQTNSRPVRSMITRKVFTEIKKFNNLPFNYRWLSPQFSEGQIKLAIKQLMAAGNLKDHSPLPEVAGGIVSQFDGYLKLKELNWAAYKKKYGDIHRLDRILKSEGKSFICNCVFYSVLQRNNLEPIEHSVCWTGWGFIEGFMREIKDIKAIKWVSRDIENNGCQFDYVPK